MAGPNAESADIRSLTRSDQVQSWFVIPIGVFIVLIFALRDPLACVNLVATMLLTYLFALGATHFLFITILGSEGLDWKVPYFLFVLLVAVGVDYNVFLMARLHEETGTLGLRAGIGRAVAQTGGLISSAAAITAVSFASFLFSPLSSLRQLGFALVVGIAVDALLVRPLLVPCGQWLLNRRSESRRMAQLMVRAPGRVAGAGVELMPACRLTRPVRGSSRQAARPRTTGPSTVRVGRGSHPCRPPGLDELVNGRGVVPDGDRHHVAQSGGVEDRVDVGRRRGRPRRW